jgi:polysaccharide biosynthesis protein PslH
MRILFLTPRFCLPTLKGDTSRVYNQLQLLSKEHEITLLSITEGLIAPSDHARVSALCERLEVVQLSRQRVLWNLGTGLFSNLPLQVSYYRSPEVQQRLNTLLAEQQFDLIHVTLIRMLPYVWDVRRLPLVVDLIDSLALNLESRRNHVRGPKRLAYEMEYRRVQAYERAAVARFDALAVTAEADKQALGGGEHIKVIPMGVDLDRFAFHGIQGRDEATVVFTGNMGYQPNEEAVLWFAAEVWPRLSKLVPNARWQIVGANPSEQVRALAQPQTPTAGAIDVTGLVPDMSEYLARASIAICPLRSGSGTQMKVQEAMAVGTPVVATSVANRGVGGVPGRDILVADTGPEFATAVADLLGDGPARERMGVGGRALVERQFRWEQHAQALSAIYADLKSGSQRTTGAVA